MKAGDGFQQCYNAQAAVDEGSQLIVATALTNGAADNGQLLPLVAAVQDNTGALPAVTLADSGYASEATFAALETQGLTAVVALGREGKAGRPSILSAARPRSAWPSGSRPRRDAPTTAPQGHPGAGVRVDQGGLGVSALQRAGTAGRHGRMAPGVSGAEPQALQRARLGAGVRC